MMGRHRYATRLYYQLSLDDLVPKKHLLRRIAEAIDFSFVYQLARPYYSYTGQPSIDPVVLFKSLLIGYLYGITSERRLLDEVQVNMAHRWFLGYDLDEPVPDHSVLSKARVRFGMQVFEAFFTKTVDLCKDAGLVNGEATFVDSTFMRANAAMKSLEPAADHEPPLPPRQYVERLFAENAGDEPPELDQLGLPESSKPRRGTTGKRLPANKRKRSRTDPDASVINHMNLGVHLAYKTHIAVDDHPARVITAVVATPGETADEHILGELLRQNRRRLGRLPKEVVADARYGTKDIYRGLEERGIHAVIPDRMGPKLHPGGVWTIREFKYDSERDAYECAAGQWLPHVYTRPSEQMSEYIAPPDVCAGCEFRDRCAPSGKPRHLRRSFERGFVEDAQACLQTEAGKTLFAKRKHYVETQFALAKDLHGLRRAQWRGRSKVQIQGWLMAAAMNLKKLTRATTLMQPA